MLVSIAINIIELLLYCSCKIILLLYISDIIERLRTDPSFRPTLHDGDCDVAQEATLIRKCWAEDALDRPDFQLVKNAYRRFVK